MMRERDLKAIMAVSTGMPAQTGWIRYLTGADLWSGQAFVFIERDSLEPLIVLWSNYLAEWVGTLTPNARVESTLPRRMPPVTRAIEVLTDLTGGTGRVGTLNLERSMFLSDYEKLRAALPALELVDLTEQANLIRQIKSPFEIDAMREMGGLLHEGFKIFEAEARPGRSTLEVSSLVEGFLHGKGCNWGRAKYSLDQRPYTLPASRDRVFKEDDVALFQYVYQSSLGYWYEVARLYSFKPLPAGTEQRYQAMNSAMHELARASVPGYTYGQAAADSDRIFREHGLKVVDKHTEDIHSIGTDISDGPPWYTDSWALKENMVVALHPASLVEGDLAFFICENYVVTPKGLEPLSPLESFYKQLG
jgi:Xaa-Pro aminopeptidase